MEKGKAFTMFKNIGSLVDAIKRTIDAQQPIAGQEQRPEVAYWCCATTPAALETAAKAKYMTALTDHAQAAGFKLALGWDRRPASVLREDGWNVCGRLRDPDEVFCRPQLVLTALPG